MMANWIERVAFGRARWTMRRWRGAVNSSGLIPIIAGHCRIRAIASPMARLRSEEHTSELQSLMRISYAVFCLKKKNTLKLSKIIIYLIFYMKKIDKYINTLQLNSNNHFEQRQGS